MESWRVVRAMPDEEPVSLKWSRAVRASWITDEMWEEMREDEWDE